MHLTACYSTRKGRACARPFQIAYFCGIVQDPGTATGSRIPSNSPGSRYLMSTAMNFFLPFWMTSLPSLKSAVVIAFFLSVTVSSFSFTPPYSMVLKPSELLLTRPSSFIRLTRPTPSPSNSEASFSTEGMSAAAAPPFTNTWREASRASFAFSSP